MRLTRKDILAFAIGIILSFVIAFGGSVLAWLLLIGRTRYSENKDALITFMLVQSFVVIPLMAALVGVFVGWFAQRAAWWVAGVSLLPILIHGVLAAGFQTGEIVLSIVCLLLGLAAAFGTSRLKSKSELPSSHL